jgi:hypothetical protein
MKAGGDVMMRAQRWVLILGLGLMATTNGAAAAKTYPATAVDTSLVITVHVHNYAEVDRKTLTEAETVATEIFRKAGVETRWIDSSDLQHTNLVGWDLTHLVLSILSEQMSHRLPVANEVMGVAPGTGLNRQTVYVLYSRVKSRARHLLAESMRRGDGEYVGKGKILGHVIAHEFGHLLLNLDSHSPTGIMRGKWDTNDFASANYGDLLFAPQQAEAIRAEVARRGHHLPENELASNSSNIN